jgi:GTP cyclohydrolase FolE2
MSEAIVNPPEIDELLEKYRELVHLQREFVALTIRLRQSVQANKFDMHRLVDVSFLLAETVKRTEETEKASLARVPQRLVSGRTFHRVGPRSTTR